jgi:DNA polymerase III epsilon subunit-like protein
MIVLDIETSGEHPSRHSILSIGAVELSNPSNTFYMECGLEEGTAFDQTALDVNGFTKEEITSGKKPALKSVLGEFLKYVEKISERTVIGYNVAFDQYFLNYYFEVHGFGRFILGWRTIDLHALIYTSMLSRNVEIPTRNGRSGITSDIALNYVGLPSEPRPHNALTGAKMEAEMTSRLLYGGNLLKEYAGFEIPEHLRK